mgnify:CR=1 FL=1
MEEVFCYVIEKRKENPSENGDMIRLFKQVKSLYNMHTDQNTDRRINTLLSGLHSIVVAIAEMRNKDSDAHGVGVNRISIDEYHARLFVNSAMTMADFILSVEIKQTLIYEKFDIYATAGLGANMFLVKMALMNQFGENGCKLNKAYNIREKLFSDLSCCLVLIR